MAEAEPAVGLDMAGRGQPDFGVEGADPRRRPLPDARLQPGPALWFGVVLTLVGFIAMAIILPIFKMSQIVK